MNLTGNEIIKEFKEFIEYSRYNVGQKSTELLENILDLINRQKAEIERYLHSIKLLEKMLKQQKMKQ